MQTLKENIRQLILAEARGEFIRQGYRGTSIQSIARHVGISVGNVYRYYPSKEAIFVDVVRPAITALEKCNRSNSQLSRGSTEIFTEEHYVGLITDSILEAILPYRAELKLLFTESSGTSVEHYLEDLYDKLYAEGLSYFASLEQQCPSIQMDMHPLFIRLDCLTWGALLKLISTTPHLSDSDVRALITDYIRFNHAGWERLVIGSHSEP